MKAYCKNTQEDERLAIDIIQRWKTDPAIRLKFGQNLAKYAAYRRGDDTQTRMH